MTSSDFAAQLPGMAIASMYAMPFAHNPPLKAVKTK